MTEINSKIKEIRKKKGLSLQNLSERCGYSKGYLSKIERSKDAPRIAVLQAISNALEVPITELFKSGPKKNQTNKNLDLIRKQDWTKHEVLSSLSGYYYEPLVNDSTNKFMTPFFLRIRKGQTTVFSHDSEEFIFVLKGPVEFNYEGKTYQMETGDSCYFDSRLNHSFTNNMDKEAELLFIKYDYRRF
ncbi:MAG: XRE family transcriptional regulator [Desulfobacterales bacterium]|nr:XRE family transcriptional regulator [Desulfobacterales bacterium]MDD4072710.1 XRE family transcriptional regulator [Desulfobacterales bacterium]MDD4393117.1 XRE family transcriptional regulator [Desulfobacterales bacterium]